jgi:hypothetical protein
LYAERYPERVEGHLFPGSFEYEAPVGRTEGLVIGRRPGIMSEACTMGGGDSLADNEPIDQTDT